MPLEHPRFRERELNVFVKRDDCLHPIMSGNKWRKLKYPLQAALADGVRTIVTMGGRWSNHLHALAYACGQLGLRSVAMVRSDVGEPLTACLRDCRAWGMELRFVSRGEYRQLRESPPDELLASLEQARWLPEGGATALAMQGVGEIWDELGDEVDHLITACGTGATVAGLAANAPVGSRVSGVAVLKGEAFLAEDIGDLLSEAGSNRRDNWRLWHDYHFGGYAKATPALLEFVRQSEAEFDLPLEPVYTGKMLYGFMERVKQGAFARGSRIVLLHTGGLQGQRGFGKRTARAQ